MDAVRKLIISGIVLPIISGFTFFILAINPIYERCICKEDACIVTKNYLFNNTKKEINKSKHNLKVVSQKGILNINLYFICIDEELYGNSCPLFQTSYYIKKNAERDLSLLNNNRNVNLLKKNIALIQGFCISLYVLLLITGTIIKRK